MGGEGALTIWFNSLGIPLIVAPLEHGVCLVVVTTNLVLQAKCDHAQTCAGGWCSQTTCKSWSNYAQSVCRCRCDQESTQDDGIICARLWPRAPIGDQEPISGCGTAQRCGTGLASVARHSVGRICETEPGRVSKAECGTHLPWHGSGQSLLARATVARPGLQRQAVCCCAWQSVRSS